MSPLPTADTVTKAAAARRGPPGLPSRHALNNCTPLPAFALALAPRQVKDANAAFVAAMKKLYAANGDAYEAEQAFKAAKPAKRAAAEEEARRTTEIARGTERNARFAL